MNLLNKINLLNKNIEIREKRYKIEKLRDTYKDLEKLYKEIESSLKQGHINIIVHGSDEKKLAQKYFPNCWIGCSGDCVTSYILEMTKQGITKLEKDYEKIKEKYDNYDR